MCIRDRPPPPPPPTTANLDITALFALVSEVSAAAGGSFMAFLDDPAVREWAAKKHQHAACLNAELEDPLNLERQLMGFDRFVVHPSVLTRFEKILAAMGGPRERRTVAALPASRSREAAIVSARRDARRRGTRG